MTNSCGFGATQDYSLASVTIFQNGCNFTACTPPYLGLYCRIFTRPSVKRILIKRLWYLGPAYVWSYEQIVHFFPPGKSNKRALSKTHFRDDWIFHIFRVILWWVNDRWWESKIMGLYLLYFLILFMKFFLWKKISFAANFNLITTIIVLSFNIAVLISVVDKK